MDFLTNFNQPRLFSKSGDNLSVSFPHGNVNFKPERRPLVVTNRFLGGLSGLFNAFDLFSREGAMDSETVENFIKTAEEMSLHVAEVFGRKPLMVMAGKVIAEASDSIITKSFNERGFNKGKVVLHDRPLLIGPKLSEEVTFRADESGISNPKGRLLLVTAGDLIQHLKITEDGPRFSWNSLYGRNNLLVKPTSPTPEAHLNTQGYNNPPFLDEVLNEFKHFVPNNSGLINPITLARQILIDYIVEAHRN